MQNFKKGAGGTPGGIGDFIFGAVLTLIALYLISNQIRVTSGFFGWRNTRRSGRGDVTCWPAGPRLRGGVSCLFKVQTGV